MLYSVYRYYRDCMRLHYVFIEEKEVLRGPIEIKPTKITNLVTTAIGARNTLAVGHRRRNSRVGEVM